MSLNALKGTPAEDYAAIGTKLFRSLFRSGELRKGKGKLPAAFHFYPQDIEDERPVYLAVSHQHTRVISGFSYGVLNPFVFSFLMLFGAHVTTDGYSSGVLVEVDEKKREVKLSLFSEFSANVCVDATKYEVTLRKPGTYYNVYSA